MKLQPLIAIALFGAALGAQAQPKAQQVFRCGPDGRIYSQTPCADGTAVNVNDPRSAEQQRAAAQAVKREQAQTEQAARERQAREAATRQGAVAHIPYTAAIKAAAPASAASAAGKGRKKAKAKPATPAQG
jgi:hypothetical protein